MFKAVLKKSRDGGKNKKDAGMKTDCDFLRSWTNQGFLQLCFSVLNIINFHENVATFPPWKRLNPSPLITF